MNVLKKAVNDSGGLSKVAADLGISVQALTNWIERGVPVPRGADFERAVQLRIRRWDMWPTSWQRIWPELIGTDGAPTAVVGGADRASESARAA